MAGKLEKMTPLQQRAVDAAVQEAVNKEIASGRSFKADAFIAEKVKAITGSEVPGHYRQDHSSSLDVAATKFIEQALQKHEKPRLDSGGQYMQLPTTPVRPKEDKGRFL